MIDPLVKMEVALLLAFEALLAERNITRAARRLDLSQPAMSARLARLRELFGDKLFVPAGDGRGVAPTPAAEAIADDLAVALAGLRRLVDADRDFDPATTRRRFVIAMHDNPAMMIGPALIGRVTRQAPSARVVIVMPDLATIAGEMEKGAVDLLVVRPETARPEWLTRSLLAERFVTAQRRGHPRGTTPLDRDAFCAANHLLVSASGGALSGLVDDALAVLGRARQVAASVQSYALAPFVVEGSDLLCTLPHRLLAGFEDRLDLFDPPLALGDFTLSAFWHERVRGDAGHAWLRAQLFAAAGAVTN